jgi:hypothetical protein
MKYFVYYEVGDYDGLAHESFNTEEELKEFLNRYSRFSFLNVIQGRLLEVTPEEYVTQWRVK